ncbi:MAG: thymidine kinase [Candidatus Eisenbacteria sp.]|nr:thymidine kinase [Candidatus Eisenbacteria bacterium]
MHITPRDVGWIEVIVGSMFSGKTEELIRRLRLARIAKQKVQVFKPGIDSRYSKGEIVSHDDTSLESISVNSSREILEKLRPDADVVGIDEGQFFDRCLPEVCEAMAGRGVRVIVAALDQDYKGQPFGPAPGLMTVAEYVTKQLAICTVCGNPANRSQRISGGASQVQVGAADSYEARCRKCFRPFVVEQTELEMPSE